MTPPLTSSSGMEGHTPGPWSVRFTNSAKETLVVIPIVAGSNSGWVVLGQCGGPSKEANAALISAAPDFLDAAEAFDRLMQQREAELGCLSDEMAAVVAKTRLAIAKAKAPSL